MSVEPLNGAEFEQLQSDNVDNEVNEADKPLPHDQQKCGV